MLACIKIAAATAVGWGLFGTTWHVAGMGSGTAPTRLASKGQSCSRFGGKYHSPLVRRNEMESTSGTPLGTLRLGRQRPSVWCYYSGRIEHRDIIGLGKSSKFQWSWWGSQTQNENTGICIFFFPLRLPISFALLWEKQEDEKQPVYLHFFSFFTFSLSLRSTSQLPASSSVFCFAIWLKSIFYL